MKVILSRKGLDSSYGGRPNAILPDGTLLAFPIPNKGDALKYSDLSFRGKSIAQLLKQLSHASKMRIGKRMRPITSEIRCHLDPDIRREFRPRSPEWLPLFGQVGASQSHLDNQGVETGDLFLYFGWFKCVEWVNNEPHYVRGAPELQIIYGYLQIGNIVRHPQQLQPWMQEHPHYDAILSQQSNDTIYVSRKNLGIDPSMPGAGPLPFHERRVLTKTGESRSKWLLPAYLQAAEISYHSGASWKDGYFQAAQIGQEFVISDSGAATQFARDMITPSH